MSDKTAVVLLTMGGPDSPGKVKPFLTELFNDGDVMMMPALLRKFLSIVIPLVRTAHAQSLYAKFGGKSPLLENTAKQAAALQQQLGEKFSCFPVYRYGPVRASDVAKQVKSKNFTRIVVLPLYPHYAHSSVKSSIKDWNRAAKSAGLSDIPTTVVMDYADYPNWVDYWVKAINQKLEACTDKPVILFSAHGLPQSHVTKYGDIYPARIKTTVDAVLNKLDSNQYETATICYQSRVGPAKWLEPALDNEIKKHGGKPVLVVPVAFVSEHTETLIELDEDYKHLADKSGITHYLRTPCPATDSGFITGLAKMVTQAQNTYGYGFFAKEKLVSLQGLNDYKAINA